MAADTTTLADLRAYLDWLEREASPYEQSEAISRGEGPGFTKLRLLVGELRESAMPVERPVLTLIEGGPDA